MQKTYNAAAFKLSVTIYKLKVLYIIKRTYFFNLKFVFVYF